MVSVSFQKNEKRKFKFLEGEPKILGITQISLSFFQITCIANLHANGLVGSGLEIPLIISSLLILIAGSLAIAATRLHLPTLRACLGMEVVSSIAAIFNLITTMITMNTWRYYYSCYYYDYDNVAEGRKYCRYVEAAHTHLFAELVIIQVALFAISVTLLVYAAKVAQCCNPGPKVPVITIRAPPPPE